ncbi:MAG: type II toxin-antitoxin system VapB family antitoxin [Candidatus Omnitrophica bacterium]|nr:type II toxin-antitoxin system VapB family antitoxin [Candidatus Omnitrophota bacterium]
MKTAKIFQNGRSQAIRLPKEYQFSGNDVYIKKFNNIVMIFSKTDPWASLVSSLEQFSDDFMDDRNQPSPEKRDTL